MKSKKFISISQKLRYFLVILSSSMIIIFLGAQGLAEWVRSNSQKFLDNHNLFSECWNEVQETERILYRYAQTPIETDKERCSILLENLQRESSILGAVIKKPEVQDMVLIIEKYTQIGNEILYGEIKTEERIVKYRQIEAYKWIMEGMHATLYQKMQEYLKTEQKRLNKLWVRWEILIIIGSTMVIGLTAGWIKGFGKQIIKPIQELTMQTEKIIAGNHSIELKYQSDVQDELDILNNSFYHMVEINNENYNNLLRKRILEKRLADTKLKLFQSRVNPHFMFNTMNMIAGLAVEENAEKTTDMLMMTAKYLRYALVYLDKAVRLDEEIKHVSDYMNIQKVRFEERFQMEFLISEESRQAIVPSMILQPLCENALVYGMEPLKKCITIKISTEIKDKKLIISVEDNGMGMQADRLEEIRLRIQEQEKYDDTEGIGIINTFQRINAFYTDICQDNKKQIKCEIESIPMLSTKISFYMPLVKQFTNEV